MDKKTMGMVALALGAYFLYTRSAAATASTPAAGVAATPLPATQANPLTSYISPITNILGTLFGSSGGSSAGGGTAGTSGVANPGTAQQGLSTLQDLGQNVFSTSSDGTSAGQSGGVDPFGSWN